MKFKILYTILVINNRRSLKLKTYQRKNVDAIESPVHGMQTIRMLNYQKKRKRTPVVKIQQC